MKEIKVRVYTFICLYETEQRNRLQLLEVGRGGRGQGGKLVGVGVI
jgi:hypothetical protein